MATPLKSIKSTFLYESMNKDKHMDNAIMYGLTKGKVLNTDDLAYEVNTINRYYKYPMKKEVMDAFTNGKLKVIVLPEGATSKVPLSVPFILGGKTELIGYVFIDNYKSYNAKEDAYSIDPKKLYCLLESTFMAMILQKSFNVIARNQAMCNDASSIFAHTFIRVLSKKYALNVDRRAYGKMLYLAAKYFMVNQLALDATSETVSNYALKVADLESPFIVNELDRVFCNQENYTNLQTFISAIATNSYLISRSLADLTIKDFISDYVKMYHPSAIFALEHPSYFLFMVDSVVLGAYLNNQAILEDIVDKSGAKIYNAISAYKY